MFHVELRQFPHVAREFNVAEEHVRERIVTPWVAGRQVEFGERKWAPERARLTIYEGPQLRTDEIAMGRGWSNATRSGEDVTARLLEQAQGAIGRAAELEQLKQELLDRCARGAIAVREAAEIAATLHAGWRASESLALAEQAVWELLHAGSLSIIREQAEVDRDEWQELLLAWDTWSGDRAAELYIGAPRLAHD